MYDKRVLSFLSEMFEKLGFFFLRLRLKIRNMHTFGMKREGVSPEGRVAASESQWSAGVGPNTHLGK